MNISQERILAKEIAIDILGGLQQAFPNIDPSGKSPIISIGYLKWAAQQVRENWETWEIDKLHRWIGWIQGILNACDITSLDVERQRVRKIKNDIQDRIAEKFKLLADEWENETSNLFATSQKLNHPAYQEIINLGQDVIPFLLQRLREKPNYYWFFVLRKLTGANPVKLEHYGTETLDLMTEDWLEWAREKGYYK